MLLLIHTLIFHSFVHTRAQAIIHDGIAVNWSIHRRDMMCISGYFAVLFMCAAAFFFAHFHSYRFLWQMLRCTCKFNDDEHWKYHGETSGHISASAENSIHSKCGIDSSMQRKNGEKANGIGEEVFKRMETNLSRHLSWLVPSSCRRSTKISHHTNHSIAFEACTRIYRWCNVNLLLVVVGIGGNHKWRCRNHLFVLFVCLLFLSCSLSSFPLCTFSLGYKRTFGDVQFICFRLNIKNTANLLNLLTTCDAPAIERNYGPVAKRRAAWGFQRIRSKEKHWKVKNEYLKCRPGIINHSRYHFAASPLFYWVACAFVVFFAVCFDCKFTRILPQL